MTIYFSEIFRKLRLDKGITQEQAANAFCVSPQAVSRWECGSTTPDIALLPTIADYFDVTIEELLGTDKSRRQAAVKKYLNDFDTAIRHGKVNDCITIARAGVQEFPNNYLLLNKLMYALFVSGSSDGNIPEWKENIEKYKYEIIELGEKILAGCTDDTLRLEARARLGFHYCEIGEPEKGREIIESLPDKNSTKEYNLYWALTGEEQLHHASKLISGTVYDLVWNIYRVAMKGNFSPEEQLDSLNIMEQIVRLIYPENDLGWWYVGLAKLYTHATVPLLLQLNRQTEAVKLIETAADYLAKEQALDETYHHVSPLLKGSVYHKLTDTADDRPQAQIILEDILSQKCYDKLKERTDFTATLEKIRKLAGYGKVTYF